MDRVDFTIVSRPDYISFQCPHCEADAEIRWKHLNPPSYWGDTWDDVKCPYCGKTVKLGDYTYD